MRTTDSDTPTLPVALACEARLGIFQATRRPKRLVKEKIVTPWGEAEVTARLGQAHLDTIEAIRACAVRVVWDSEGKASKALVDLYNVRRMSGQWSGSGFETVLTDILAAFVVIRAGKRLRFAGSMLASEIEETKVQGEDGRYLHKIVFGPVMRGLMAHDIVRIRSYKQIQALAMLHGISSALVRHVMSHRHAPSGGWRLNALIEAVCCRLLDATDLKNRRRELRAETAVILKLGVLIDWQKERVGYARVGVVGLPYKSIS